MKKMASYKIGNDWDMYVLLLKICALKTKQRTKLDIFLRIVIYRVFNQSVLNGY